MIYLLLYLAVGGAFSVFLTVGSLQRSAARNVSDIPREKLEAMTAREKQLLALAIETANTPFRTWQVVLAGLIWPTQVIAWVLAHVMTSRINRRAEKQHDMAYHAVCPCPGCDKNLVMTPGVDCVEDARSDRYRFVCVCGVVSDWEWGPRGTVLVGIVKPVVGVMPPPPPAA